MADQKLRILQVLRAPVGGLFRHVLDLTHGLAARGHEIGIVIDSLSADALTERKLEPMAALATLGVHRFPMPRVAGTGDLTTPFHIRSLAGRLQIDILHGHGAKGGMNARLGRLGSKKAALYTPHGGTLHFGPNSVSGRAFRAIERLLLTQTDAVIFESAFAQSAFVRTIARPTCPTPIVHNGLAESEFVPITPANDAADFLFVGELRDLKGVSVLLEAFVGLKRADGSPATMMVVGDGPDRARYLQTIERLGLVERIEMPGARVARSAFPTGRCIVVPSLAESLPYIVLEATAAGLPVIATDVGGVPEIFGPTASALIPAGNAAALRTAMQAFLDDPDQMAREARERLDFIRPRFSLDAMTDSIEALYRQAIGRR